MTLDGRCAVVTGSSSGIGRAISRKLAAEGARVVLGDERYEPRGREEMPTVDAILEAGDEASFHRTDVTDETAVAELVTTAVDIYGRLDILVNNAGVGAEGRLDETSTSEWQRVMDVNLTGVYNCAKHAIPYLREADDARLVNIASQLGLVGRHSMAAYCASKGGVVNLTRQMALDYAAHDLTVNAVCPGVIETELARESLQDPETRAWMADRTPVDSFGTPEDVAHAVEYLCSPEAGYVTGHCLVVDGGWTAQ